MYVPLGVALQMTTERPISDFDIVPRRRMERETHICLLVQPFCLTNGLSGSVGQRGVEGSLLQLI